MGTVYERIRKVHPDGKGGVRSWDSWMIKPDLVQLSVFCGTNNKSDSQWVIGISPLFEILFSTIIFVT